MDVELATPAPPVRPAAVSVEPGWKTTEFWQTVIAMFLGLLVLFGVVKPEAASNPTLQILIQYIAGLIAVVLPASFYAVGRSIRKRGLPG